MEEPIQSPTVGGGAILKTWLSSDRKSCSCRKENPYHRRRHCRHPGGPWSGWQRLAGDPGGKKRLHWRGIAAGYFPIEPWLYFVIDSGVRRYSIRFLAKGIMQGIDLDLYQGKVWAGQGCGELEALGVMLGEWILFFLSWDNFFGLLIPVVVLGIFSASDKSRYQPCNTACTNKTSGPLSSIYRHISPD